MYCSSFQPEIIRLRQKNFKLGFKIVSAKKGSSIDYSDLTSLTFIFVRKGKIRLLLGNQKEEFFSEREMFLLKSGSGMFEILQNTEIILMILEDGWSHFYEELRSQKGYHVHERFLFSIPTLEIKPGLELYLESITNYIQESKSHMGKLDSLNQNEIKAILKRCYTRNALLVFFAVLNEGTRDFYKFINDNFTRYKGVEELIGISGLTQSTFNRKFREYFGESPYQWMLGKRANTIHSRLTGSSDAIGTIMKEYGFTDASHFNRFCRTMFGKTPTQIRRDNVAE